MSPAFDLQQTLRIKTFGIPFWKKETLRRKKLNINELFSKHASLLDGHTGSVAIMKQQKKNDNQSKIIELSIKKANKVAAATVHAEETLANWIKLHTHPIELDFFEKYSIHLQAENDIVVAHAAKAAPEEMIALRRAARLVRPRKSFTELQLYILILVC